MAHDENLTNLQNLNLREDEATDAGTRTVRYLIERLQEAQRNPSLGPTVHALMQNQLVPQFVSATAGPIPPVDTTPKGPLPGAGLVGGTAEGAHAATHGSSSEATPPRRRVASNRPSSPKRQKIESTSSSSSRSGRSRRNRFHRTRSEKVPTTQAQEGVAEQGEAVHAGRGTQRTTQHQRRRSVSPPRNRQQDTTTRNRRRSNSPSHRRRRTPSPSDSPYDSGSDDSSSSQESRRRHTRKVSRRKHPAWKRSRKISKFREGGKNVTFMTYDGAYAATDKILAFIQQFDAAFGGEEFDERSKLRHVAMYLQKSARQWWASLRITRQSPKTWTECRKAIMTQFLTEHAEDDVMAEWRSLHLEKGESITKYMLRCRAPHHELASTTGLVMTAVTHWRVR